MNHPPTIYNPEVFDKSQWQIECPHCGNMIGFDGIFHWGWLLDLLPRKISPMDFDGVLEAGQGHYLIFETKDIKNELPQGQLYTLSRLHRAKSFTVMIVWGKTEPEQFTWIKRDGSQSGIFKQGVEEARRFVEKWISWAEENNSRI